MGHGKGRKKQSVLGITVWMRNSRFLFQNFWMYVIINVRKLFKCLIGNKGGKDMDAKAQNIIRHYKNR